jgi:hypothetical protein
MRRASSRNDPLAAVAAGMGHEHRNDDIRAVSGIPPIAAKLTRRSEDMRPAIRDDVLKTRPTLPFNFRLRTGPERSCGPREHRCAERLQSVNFVWRLSLHVPTEEADGDLVGIEVEQHEAVLLNR